MSEARAEAQGSARVQRLVVALVTVFLLFAAQIRSLSKERNRYFRHWEAMDGWAIAADVALVTVVLFLVSLALDRAPRWLRGLGGHLFVLALACGVLSNLWSSVPFPWWTYPLRMALIWSAVLALVAFSLGTGSDRLVRWSRTLALVFSPIILLVAAPMPTWKPWGSPPEPLAPLGSGRKATPVYLFVFDEWSYFRSVKDGSFRPELKNLRRLASQSVTFADARSPMDFTYHSLPALLYQVDDVKALPRVLVGRGEAERIPEGAVAAPRARTILGEARDRGYETVLLGFYLPYRKLLAEDLGRCRAYPLYPKGATFTGRMGFGMFENLRFWVDPVSAVKFRQISAGLFTQHWLGLHRDLEQDLWTVIETYPENTLLFAHWPLPHAPFIFNDDGTFRGPIRVDYHRAMNEDEDQMLGTGEEYERNLRALDRLVGEIVARLQAAGRYDDALLILTSDHSWRYDTHPGFLEAPQEAGFRHVPLVVKLPHQKAGRAIVTEFPITRLRPLVEAVLGGEPDEAKLAAALGDPGL